MTQAGQHPGKLGPEALRETSKPATGRLAEGSVDVLRNGQSLQPSATHPKQKRPHPKTVGNCISSPVALVLPLLSTAHSGDSGARSPNP